MRAFRTAGVTMLLALVMATLPANAADFNDNDYHEYLLYDMDTPQVDVLIVPPESP